MRLAGHRHRPVHRDGRVGARALYPLERARMVPPDYLKRFCLKGQGPHEGIAADQPRAARAVRFLQANLMQPLPELPMFDVIFLRNVLIYFDNDAKAQIVRRVLGRLKPDGVLYIGHAESMSALNLPLRPLATAIYGHA
jgi:chemotaxis protein methyltransferase CheR